MDKETQELDMALANAEYESRLLRARVNRLEQEVDVLYTALRTVYDSVNEGCTFDYIDNVLMVKLENAMRRVQRG